MAVSQDELMYLQSQLEGIESIFLELLPFGIELKRQQVQDYYEQRFRSALSKNKTPVAQNELRRQFNTKANQVRNLIDKAESLGGPVNKVALIRAAAGAPNSKADGLKPIALQFCQSLVLENRIDPAILTTLARSTDLTPFDARVILTSVMFLFVDQIDYGNQVCLLPNLLSQVIELVRSRKLLPKNDPFLNEATCALESMQE